MCTKERPQVPSEQPGSPHKKPTEAPASPPAPETPWQKITRWYRYRRKVGDDVFLGLRLMGSDIMFAVRLMGRAVNRLDKLNRREKRHIRRTMVDLVKLLPFAAVLALPGGSVAIPICLRFAPGLLPSTFVKKADSNTPNVHAIKEHISSALQLRVRRLVDDLNAKQDREMDLERAFSEMHSKAAAGVELDWTRLAAQFKENTVLDLVDTTELYNMFKLLGGHPVGGRTVVRYRLLRTIEALKIDDDLMQRLGTESLEFVEVVAACRKRAISLPAIPASLLEYSSDELREELAGIPLHGNDPSDPNGPEGVAADPRSFSLAQLNVWIDVAHVQKVPISLLLHLRTFVSERDSARLFEQD